MGWKPEYAATRRAKYHADEAERERRKAQGRSPDANAEYMRKYYADNRERFAEYQRANAERRRTMQRERYANDAAYRERCKQSARGRDPEAVRDGKLRAAFGITATEYDAMLDRQQGACAICDASSGDSRGNRLHVDHCHTTGRVRGLLCAACNFGIGKFADDADRLRRAADYLS